MLKQLGTGAISQSRYLWKILVFLHLPIIFLFMMVVLLSRINDDLSVAFLLRDITATGNLPFYAGFVSQLMVILWSAALAVCLLTLVIVKRRTGDFVRSRRLLLFGSILTGILLVDDTFLFHEVIAPEYLHIAEEIVFAGYLGIGIAFVVLNWREILSTEFLLLILALAMFGLSIVLDEIPVLDLQVRYFWEQLELLLEDGLKFAGIATWLLYFARYAIRQFETISPKSSAPS